MVAVAGDQDTVAVGLADGSVLVYKFLVDVCHPWLTVSLPAEEVKGNLHSLTLSEGLLVIGFTGGTVAVFKLTDEECELEDILEFDAGSTTVTAMGTHVMHQKPIVVHEKPRIFVPRILALKRLRWYRLRGRHGSTKKTNKQRT